MAGGDLTIATLTKDAAALEVVRNFATEAEFGTQDGRVGISGTAGSVGGAVRGLQRLSKRKYPAPVRVLTETGHYANKQHNLR